MALRLRHSSSVKFIYLSARCSHFPERGFFQRLSWVSLMRSSMALREAYISGRRALSFLIDGRARHPAISFSHNWAICSSCAVPSSERAGIRIARFASCHFLFAIYHRSLSCLVLRYLYPINMSIPYLYVYHKGFLSQFVTSFLISS